MKWVEGLEMGCGKIIKVENGEIEKLVLSIKQASCISDLGV